MTNTSNTWIEDFLHSLRIDRGASQLTLQAYQTDLTQFFQGLPETSSLLSISQSDVQNFLARLYQQELKPASLARKISALSQFFKFCCMEKGLETNPMERIQTPSRPNRLPTFLSIEQVTTLLETTLQGLPYPQAGELREGLRARDRAMVYLLYATGLRVSELVSLTPNQIDLSIGYLRIKGKGNKERIAPFAPIAGEHLQDYQENFRPHLKPSTPHLFINHRGTGLTRQTLWKTLKSLALQAGIPVSLSPHTLRHSFATHLLQSGMNLRSLQMLMGHSDLSTTQIYTHITPEHLKDAHQKYHPRGED